MIGALLLVCVAGALALPTFELLRCVDSSGEPFVRLDARGAHGTMYTCDFAWKEYAPDDYGGASITLSGYDIAHMQLSYDRKTFAQLAAPDNVLRLVHTRAPPLDAQTQPARDARARTQWFSVKFRYFECVDDGAPLTLAVQSLRRPGDRALVEFAQSRAMCGADLQDTSDGAALVDGTAAAFAIWLLVILLCVCIGCIYIE